mmetsp:Transcript_536/g.907  ORF Transcript_536/g.907 Transcript_536/m.907 type:complete len:188 (-) Transcript_536:164-727(-)
MVKRPVRIAAAVALSVLSMAAWLAVIFGDPEESYVLQVDNNGAFVLEQVAKGAAADTVKAGKVAAKQQNLAFDATTASATWPSEKNPLRDFDADFLDQYEHGNGFPTTTGSAEWPFTKNPLLGFDGDFKESWKGWEGPEHNVYAELPQEYPVLETNQLGNSPNYPAWANSGGEPENNVFMNYDFPDY